MNNSDLIAHYLEWLTDAKGASRTTIYNYAAILARYEQWIDPHDLGSVTIEIMESFVKRPRRTGSPSASTMQKDAVCIRELHKYLHARGFIRRNVSTLLVSPTVRNTRPKPVPDDVWKDLWQADLPRYERIAYGLGFFGGLRRAEVCQLTPAQVDEFQLVGFVRKGGGDDTLPLADLCKILHDRLPHLGAETFYDNVVDLARERRADARLIDWEAAPSMWRVYQGDGQPQFDIFNKRMSHRCEILRLPHLTPHMLRHSFVTNLLRAGVPLHLVSRMANHTSPTVTARYIKASGTELREWMSVTRRD